MRAWLTTPSGCVIRTGAPTHGQRSSTTYKAGAEQISTDRCRAHTHTHTSYRSKDEMDIFRALGDIWPRDATPNPYRHCLGRSQTVTSCILIKKRSGDARRRRPSIPPTVARKQRVVNSRTRAELVTFSRNWRDADALRLLRFVIAVGAGRLQFGVSRQSA